MTAVNYKVTTMMEEDEKAIVNEQNDETVKNEPRRWKLE